MASLALAFDILARDKASKTFNDVGDSAERAGRKGDGFGKRMGGMLAGTGGLIAKFGAGAVASFGALGIAGAKWGLDVAAANEQAKISFTTMLGSATKADAFLKQMQQFAATTPFEFPELQSAASSLISAGINADKVIPIMRTLGDVTSGMGTGSEGVQRATIALQQMSAAGRITGEDLNQLRDAGIPVYDLLAKATGKSKAEVVKLAQAGKLGSKELGQMMKALETGKGLERFSGLMDKQSQSLTGMISTFKDTLGQGLANAIQPLIPMIKTGLGAASDFLGKALAFIAQVLPKIGTALSPVVAGVKSFFGSVTSGGGSTSGIFTMIKNAIAGIASAIAPVIPVVVTFVTGTLVPLFQRVVTLVMTQVVPAFTGIVRAVVGFVQVAMPIVSSFVSGMIARFAPLMPQVRAIFGTVAAIITQVTQLISTIWNNWGEGLMNVIGSIFSGIIGVIGPALNVIKSVIQTITSAIRGDWSGVWAGIKGIVSNAFGIIKAVVSGGLNVLRTIFGGVLSKIGSAVSTGLSNVVKFFSELPGRILSGLGDMGGRLFTYGVNTIQGFINGIVSKAGEIVAVVRDKVVGVLPDFVKDFLGIHSPSRVMAELGKWTGLGLAVGIAGTQKQVVGRMEKVVQALAASSKKGLTAYARGVERQLSAHAARRDAITTRLTAAQAKLKGLQADSAKYGSDARQRVLDSGTVVGMNTFGNIVEGLKRSVATGKQFATAIGHLRSAGLNKTSLDQIIQAGPAEGLAAATQLLKGGKGGIGQVNALVSQLASSAGSVGKQASSAMYGAGIQAASGLVKGLQSQQAQITKVMTDIARGMVNNIKSALKIKSPSRVFMEVGGYTAQGMALGLERGAGRVHRAANALVPQVHVPAFGAAGGASAAVPREVKLHPHSVADVASAMSRVRPVASLDRRTVQRDLVAGMP